MRKQPPDPVVEADADIETLRGRIAELTEAVAARDTFIAVTAHELRNPMTPIIGHIELLLSRVRAGRCRSKQVEEQLERIQHTVNRYVKRTTVLLDVSRIASGNLRLEAETFNLTTLLREVAGEFADAARRIGVPITVAPPTACLAPGIGWPWSRSSTT